MKDLDFFYSLMQFHLFNLVLLHCVSLLIWKCDLSCRYPPGMTYHYSWATVISTLLLKYPKNQVLKWRLLQMRLILPLSRIPKRGNFDITRKIHSNYDCHDVLLLNVHALVVRLYKKSNAAVHAS